MMQPKSDKNIIQQEIHQLLVQLLAMIDHSPGLEIQQFALEAMVRLTGSSLGYIYAIDSKAGTTRLENAVGSRQTLKSIARAQPEDLAEAGPWSTCLTSDKPQLCRIANLTTALFGTINQGLAVPVQHHAESVAVIGVGNSPAPYRGHDEEVLLELATALGRIIVRKHLHDSIPDDIT